MPDRLEAGDGLAELDPVEGVLGGPARACAATRRPARGRGRAGRRRPPPASRRARPRVRRRPSPTTSTRPNDGSTPSIGALRQRRRLDLERDVRPSPASAHDDARRVAATDARRADAPDVEPAVDRPSRAPATPRPPAARTAGASRPSAPASTPVERRRRGVRRALAREQQRHRAARGRPPARRASRARRGRRRAPPPAWSAVACSRLRSNSARSSPAIIGRLPARADGGR